MSTMRPNAGETWTSRTSDHTVTVRRVTPGVGGDAVHLTDGSVLPEWQFLKGYRRLE
jgi:hypothetical protein